MNILIGFIIGTFVALLLQKSVIKIQITHIDEIGALKNKANATTEEITELLNKEDAKDKEAYKGVNSILEDLSNIMDGGDNV